MILEENNSNFWSINNPIIFLEDVEFKHKESVWTIKKGTYVYIDKDKRSPIIIRDNKLIGDTDHINDRELRIFNGKDTWFLNIENNRIKGVSKDMLGLLIRRNRK